MLFNIAKNQESKYILVMKDFTIFDPTEHADLMLGKIKNLKSQNILLMVCLIALGCIAGFYAYRYYKLKDKTD